MFRNHFRQQFPSAKGQALIGVLAIIAISSILVTSLMTNSLISADSLLKLRQSSQLINNADSFLESAILKLLRDPSYPGETLTVGNNQVIIEITGDNPKIILVKSTNSSGDILRKLQAQASFSVDGVLTVSNWQEI